MQDRPDARRAAAEAAVARAEALSRASVSPGAQPHPPSRTLPASFATATHRRGASTNVSSSRAPGTTDGSHDPTFAPHIRSGAVMPPKSGTRNGDSSREERQRSVSKQDVKHIALPQKRGDGHRGSKNSRRRASVVAAAALRRQQRTRPLAPDEIALGRQIPMTAAHATDLLRKVARGRSTRANAAENQLGESAATQLAELLGWDDTRGLPIAEGMALRRHQLRALCWMRERERLSRDDTHGIAGGVLSLNMGMGKTLTTLAHILVRPRDGTTGPTLVVCSKTVLFEWKSQGVEKFFGANTIRPVRALYFHKDAHPGGRRALDAIRPEDIARCDLVVTTYDVCRAACRRWHFDEPLRERQPGRNGKMVMHMATTPTRLEPRDRHGPALLYAVPWERVVLDESQTIANPTTAGYRSVMALPARYKWCLTGTPVRNYDTDIWAQMRFTGYRDVATAADWREQGDALYVAHELPRAVLSMGFGDCTAAPEPTGDARLDDELAEEARAESEYMRIPPRTERVHAVAPTARQVEVHRRLLGLARQTIEALRAGRVSFASVLMVLTRLRQAAIAPHLMMMGPSDAQRIASALAAGTSQDAERAAGMLAKGLALAATRHVKSGSNRRRARRPTSFYDRGDESETDCESGDTEGDESEIENDDQESGEEVEDEEEEEESGNNIDHNDTIGDLDGHPPPIFGDDAELRAWCADRHGSAGLLCSKTRAVCDILAAIPGDEKAVVFSSFRSCLLLAALAIRQVRPLKSPPLRDGEERAGREPYAILVDGTIKGAERAALFDRFRSDPWARVLLMTYRVGAEGINLTEANHCIRYEPWWNHAVHAQADARLCRLGQTRPVTVHTLATRNTIEAGILRLCDAKRMLADSYVEQSRELLEAVRSGRRASTSAAATRERARVARQHGSGTLNLEMLWRLVTADYQPAADDAAVASPAPLVAHGAGAPAPVSGVGATRPTETTALDDPDVAGGEANAAPPIAYSPAQSVVPTPQPTRALSSRRVVAEPVRWHRSPRRGPPIPLRVRKLGE